MDFILESDNLDDYLQEFLPIINFNAPKTKALIDNIKEKAEDDLERAKLAFEFSRDEIAHSFDTKNQIVTINAEDVLEVKEGICFAKSHLLATLLRGLGIPTGFCYQRVLKTKEPNSGFALHGLNAVFIKPYGWFRLDPRGNKPGINSQFSIEKEMLAYPIRTELGEVDYPNIFVKPLSSVILKMHESKNTNELFDLRPASI